MSRRKRKLTAKEKAEKRRRRLEFMTIFVNGKQKRVRRPPTIDGMPVDEFIARNADPVWLAQNEMWEELYQYELNRDAAAQQPPDAEVSKPDNLSKEKRMAIKFSEVEMAFDFVGSAPYGDHSACIHRKTGQTFFSSEMADMDEMPEDAGGEDYLSIPHKNDLELGADLVGSFVNRHAPQLAGEVGRIFSRRGAYGRYKDLLERHGLLQKWHDFENEATRAAILEWCRKNGLEVDMEDRGPVGAEEQRK